jgi:YD repeat-containing protein
MIKSPVPAHTQQQSAYHPPAHTCTISGATLPCPISISGSITSLISERSDESGSIDYEYGKMGEVIAETRTLKRLDPLSTTREARIEYTSNYLGQMESVRYPDGEEIRYDYDEGGQVIHVEGVRTNGSTTVFVERIGYDEFGQRTYLEYGNGDVTCRT